MTTVEPGRSWSQSILIDQRPKQNSRKPKLQGKTIFSLQMIHIWPEGSFKLTQISPFTMVAFQPGADIRSVYTQK